MELPRAVAVTAQITTVLRRHYPEYLMEAGGLGFIMIVAAFLTTLIVHPALPLHQAIALPIVRRFLIGLGIGLTVIALVYSPWGKQSGAHFNPAVTLTYFRLGKVKPWDAVFYVLFQFCGAVLGLGLAGRVLRGALAEPAIHYIVTIPGTGGAAVAFFAELMISFGLMMMVLVVSNHPSLGRYTGLFAGALIVAYITFEAPLSGMSMNPARTFASAVSAQHWTALWVYFTAPLSGMLLASETYVRWQGRSAVRCAKLHHQNNKRCIFRCGYRQRGSAYEAFSLSDRLPS